MKRCLFPVRGDTDGGGISIGRGRTNSPARQATLSTIRQRARFSNFSLWVPQAAGVLLSLAVVQHALAQPFTYQGRLTENGVGVTGTYDFYFELVNASDGGITLGEQSLTQVSVTEGMFDVRLNANSEFGANSFLGGPRWLQIRVKPTSAGAYELLMPRTLLTATPLATVAQVATRLSSPDGTPSEALTVDPAGRIGIGTNTPAGQLHVRTGDWQSAVLESSSNDGTSLVLHNTSAGGEQWSVTSLGDAAPWTGSLAVEGPNGHLRVSPTGELGINTFPNKPLTVRGELPTSEWMQFRDSNDGNRWHLNGMNGGLNFAETGVSDTRLFLAQGGNIGVNASTNIQKALTIRSTSSTPEWMQFRDNSDADRWHVNGLNNGLNIAESGVDDARLFIAAGGNVGIGRPAPACRLDVNGGVRAAAGASSDAGFSFSHAGHVGGMFQNSAGTLQFHSGGAQRISILPTGQIGLGTSWPDESYVVHMRGDTVIEREGVSFLDFDRDASLERDRMRLGWDGTSLYVEKVDSPDARRTFEVIHNGTGPGHHAELRLLDPTGDWEVRALVLHDNVAGYVGVLESDYLVAPGKAFKIDHPLDPANKYLYHSCVESPDMKNIYDGVITTDSRGYATITLPAYFEALNKGYRYQLTVIDSNDDAAFVQAKVVREVEENRFTIRTSAPGTQVSWQVTGIRDDAFARAARIGNEVDKVGPEKGRYMHPRLFGQADDLAIGGIGKSMPISDVPAE